MMKVTFEDIMRIHKQGITMYGGSDGIRDKGRVESAINNIYQTAFGEELYPELTDKAASLVYSLIKGHPFVDGNKRMGVASMITFLRMNGYEIQATNEEIIELGLKIAQSGMSREAISDWIISHKNERTISRELTKPILKQKINVKTGKPEAIGSKFTVSEKGE